MIQDPRDWWPMCAVCGRVVDALEVDPGLPDRGIRRFTVRCHGQSERSAVGIWAAFELQSKKRRLPDAFKK